MLKDKEIEKTFKDLEHIFRLYKEAHKATKAVKKLNIPINDEYELFKYFRTERIKYQKNFIKALKRALITIISMEYFGQDLFEDFSIEIEMKWKGNHHKWINKIK